MVEKFTAEISSVERFMVEKSVVEKIMVESPRLKLGLGVEKSGVELSFNRVNYFRKKH